MWIKENTYQILAWNELTKYQNPKEWFQVDDFIAPVIIELNRRNYRTLYCCSGHLTTDPTDNNRICVDVPYIMFHNWVDLPSIPTDWTLGFEGRAIYLYDLIPEAVINQITHNNMHEYLPLVYDVQLVVFDEMLKWAKSLPDYRFIISDSNDKIRQFYLKICSSGKYEEFRVKFVGDCDNKIIKSARARCCRKVYNAIITMIGVSYKGHNSYIYWKLYMKYMDYAIANRDSIRFQNELEFDFDNQHHKIKQEHNYLTDNNEVYL